MKLLPVFRQYIVRILEMLRDGKGKFGLTVLALLLLLSMPAVLERIRIEAVNDRVEISMDLDEAAALCERKDFPLDEFLLRCREAGLVSVVISEEPPVLPVFFGTPASFSSSSPVEKRTLPDGLGLAVVSRPKLSRDPARLKRALREGESVLLDDREIPGYGGREEESARFLAENRCPYIFMEFNSAAGGDRLQQLLPGEKIEAHTISLRELRRWNDTSFLLDRWMRAVRERGKRFLLVHLQNERSIDENISFIRQLSQLLRQKGYATGRARPPAYPLHPLPRLRLSAALLCTLLVPLAGLAAAVRCRRPWAAFLVINAATVAGGVVVSALLCDLLFMQRIVEVPFVKILLFAPLLLSVFIVFTREQLCDLARTKVRPRHLALTAVLAAAVAVIIVRSGNGSAEWLIPDEGLRRFLENLLSVRPRTKEFLVGQPLLLAGFCLGQPLLVLLGMLGQVSIMNTFLHAHTPVTVSLIRTFNGMWLGTFFGLCAVAVVKAFRPRDGEKGRSRVLISGYYGFDNGGDELVLAALIATVRERLPGATITVLSVRPEATAARHGVNGVDRWRWHAILRAMRESDLFISGGGGLFQDVTGSLSLYYYLSLIVLARLCGTKAVVYAAGVNELKFFNRLPTAAILRLAERVTVRDEASAALLRRWGCPSDRIDVTADPVLAGESPVRALTSVGPSRIALVLRPPLQGGLSAVFLAALADELVSRTGARTVFIPFHPAFDLAFSREVRAAMASPSELVLWENTDGLCDALSSCDLVVSQRLHGLILALRSGIPLVGLSDDPKLRRFLREIHQENGAPLPAMTVADILALVRERWERREPFRQEAGLLTAGFRERARHSEEMLFSALARE